jgi:Tfp pilus assembly protein PilP
MAVHNRWRKSLRGVVACCFLGVLSAGPALAASPEAAQPGAVQPGTEEPGAFHTGPVPVPPAAVAPAPSPVPGANSQASAAAKAQEEWATNRQRILEALSQPDFSYNTNRSIDPFIPFITPETGRPPGAVGAEETELPPEQQKPLTPLQKMSIGEIQNGLRAIVWGDLGRKAVIEDGAGKGYIVTVGTPAGDKDGTIVDIFNDRVVIKQNVWDPKLKKLLAQNSTIKLKKEKEK